MLSYPFADEELRQSRSRTLTKKVTQQVAESGGDISSQPQNLSFPGPSAGPPAVSGVKTFFLPRAHFILSAAPALLESFILRKNSSKTEKMGIIKPSWIIGHRVCGKQGPWS